MDAHDGERIYKEIENLKKTQNQLINNPRVEKIKKINK